MWITFVFAIAAAVSMFIPLLSVTLRDVEPLTLPEHIAIYSLSTICMAVSILFAYFSGKNTGVKNGRDENLGLVTLWGVDAREDVRYLVLNLHSVKGGTRHDFMVARYVDGDGSGIYFDIRNVKILDGELEEGCVIAYGSCGEDSAIVILQEAETSRMVPAGDPDTDEDRRPVESWSEASEDTPFHVEAINKVCNETIIVVTARENPEVIGVFAYDLKGYSIGDDLVVGCTIEKTFNSPDVTVIKPPDDEQSDILTGTPPPSDAKPETQPTYEQG